LTDQSTKEDEMITANRNTQTSNAQKVTEPHPVKATALQYIHETVEAERYEELPELLAIAREFGATEWEIRIALMHNVEE
jgi:hypothetical protein